MRIDISETEWMEIEPAGKGKVRVTTVQDDEVQVITLTKEEAIKFSSNLLEAAGGEVVH